MSAAIELDRVVKRFGPTVAVNSVSLSIPAAELFAFVGPNGAGKTTTIKMITGLLRPNQGRIEVCGRSMTENGSAAKRLLRLRPGPALSLRQAHRAGVPSLRRPDVRHRTEAKGRRPR